MFQCWAWGTLWPSAFCPLGPECQVWRGPNSKDVWGVRPRPFDRRTYGRPIGVNCKLLQSEGVDVEPELPDHSLSMGRVSSNHTMPRMDQQTVYSRQIFGRPNHLVYASLRNVTSDTTDSSCIDVSNWVSETWLYMCKAWTASISCSSKLNWARAEASVRGGRLADRTGYQGRTYSRPMPVGALREVRQSPRTGVVIVERRKTGWLTGYLATMQQQNRSRSRQSVKAATLTALMNKADAWHGRHRCPSASTYDANR